jgi:hypothetical protein
MDKNTDDKWHGWKLAASWMFIVLLGAGFWFSLAFAIYFWVWVPK